MRLLELAKIHKDQLHLYTESFPTSNAIFWLKKALEIAQYQKRNLNDSINLENFFSSFIWLTEPACKYIFDKDTDLLIDAIKKNNSITKISVSSGEQYGDFNHINHLLTNYLVNTKSLKTLDIGASPFEGPRLGQVDIKYMKFIIDGLKLNSSIEVVDLSAQWIGDQRLKMLLEALKANPNSQIKEINLLASQITDKGAQEIIKFLQENETTKIEIIDLRYNTNLSEKVKNELHELFEEKNSRSRHIVIPTWS